jgi:hypothetical protein
MHSGAVFDVDWMGLLTREVLRERTPALIAEACAWAVGLSDGPHLVRRGTRSVPSGSTLGERAVGGFSLAPDDDVRLDLADAVPGSFRDALGAHGPDGGSNADRFDVEVLVPFVLETCLVAAERARRDRPTDWADLADDVGEDETDATALVRSGGWEAPLRTDAELLVLVALGDVPLLEVESEGLPLSLVRAAEAVTRAAAPVPAEAIDEADLSGVLFLATAAIRAARLPEPVPPEAVVPLVSVLRNEGLEDDELLQALPLLAVTPEAADRVRDLIGRGGRV